MTMMMMKIRMLLLLTPWIFWLLFSFFLLLLMYVNIDDAVDNEDCNDDMDWIVGSKNEKLQYHHFVRVFLVPLKKVSSY